MYYILEGSSYIEIDSISYYVTKGSVVWIPGDVIYGVFCRPDKTLK